MESWLIQLMDFMRGNDEAVLVKSLFRILFNLIFEYLNNLRHKKTELNSKLGFTVFYKLFRMVYQRTSTRRFSSKHLINSGLFAVPSQRLN